jgi:hypothetical protein
MLFKDFYSFQFWKVINVPLEGTKAVKYLNRNIYLYINMAKDVMLKISTFEGKVPSLIGTNNSDFLHFSQGMDARLLFRYLEKPVQIKTGRGGHSGRLNALN